MWGSVFGVWGEVWEKCGECEEVWGGEFDRYIDQPIFIGRQRG